ncbi:PPR repeat protein [Medicago truncatula]|uniref:PPR repeat protein n=1 Tax=Medicago truncatula TaxID=3880 RepID=G7IDF0_MEDTR|nr:PPR repeat protein [Medicago truncatula]
MFIDDLVQWWKTYRCITSFFKNFLIKGYNLNVIKYTIMISVLCKEGLFEEAFVLLSKMEDTTRENDKAEKKIGEMIARVLLKSI